MKDTKIISGWLTVTAPSGATCGVYSGVPSSTSYFKSIDPTNAIEPTRVDFLGEITAYHYGDLDVGIYHVAASMDGYTAVCQILNYTAEKKAAGARMDMELFPLLGNGYESGYVMLNSDEFISARLESKKDTWGEKYEHLFATPQFSREKSERGRHQQTTNEEMLDFISKLSEKNENMHVFSLGKTPKYGFDMPLVLFTREDISGKSLEDAASIIRANGKPTVQYTAQIHSNEPASTEGALAMMLSLSGKYGDEVLDKVDVYIIPRINIDGAVEVIRTSPTTGEDMNRDYLYMNNKEIRMIVSAYNKFLPEIAIDGHEKRSNFLTTDEARCTDMELQVGSGSLNHPAIMTDIGMKIALKAIDKGLKLGLRSHFYSTLACGAGGSAGSSYFGTRNSISFLVETPGGTTLGGFCMARRVMAQYVLASTAISYAAEHAEEVISTVHSSRESMALLGHKYDETRLTVLEHGKAVIGSLSSPLINVPSGIVTDQNNETEYTDHKVALRTRPRATAYVIPVGLKNEGEILRVAACHAIPYYTLKEGCRVFLKRYSQVGDEATLSEESEVSFAEGAYVFVNTVPSTVLSVIMEPDFNSASKRKMSLFSMGLIDADEDGRLPLYRYCRNLSDGKIECAD